MLEIKNQAEAKSLEKVLHRIPKHIGIIPDGNRRWARAHACLYRNR